MSFKGYANLKCKIAGCENRPKARELCKKHYQHLYRSKVAMPVIDAGYAKRTCKAAGCERRSVAQELCAMHYQRLRKNGSTEIDAPRERHGERNGARSSPEYQAWQNMRERCTNSGRKDFSYYGGRGIRVCEKWDKSFSAFLVDVGRRPSAAHTIDRKDTNGHYEPGNVRWATRAEQSRNRRPFSMKGKSPLQRLITANGITDNITGWARRLGVAREVVRNRLKYGWDPVRAVTEPVGTTQSGPKKGVA